MYERTCDQWRKKNYTHGYMCMCLFVNLHALVSACNFLCVFFFFRSKIEIQVRNAEHSSRLSFTHPSPPHLLIVLTHWRCLCAQRLQLLRQRPHKYSLSYIMLQVSVDIKIHRKTTSKQTNKKHWPTTVCYIFSSELTKRNNVISLFVIVMIFSKMPWAVTPFRAAANTYFQNWLICCFFYYIFPDSQSCVTTSVNICPQKDINWGKKMFFPSNQTPSLCLKLQFCQILDLVFTPCLLLSLDCDHLHPTSKRLFAALS